MYLKVILNNGKKTFQFDLEDKFFGFLKSHVYGSSGIFCCFKITVLFFFFFLLFMSTVLKSLFDAFVTFLKVEQRSDFVKFVFFFFYKLGTILCSSIKHTFIVCCLVRKKQTGSHVVQWYGKGLLRGREREGRVGDWWAVYAS